MIKGKQNRVVNELASISFKRLITSLAVATTLIISSAGAFILDYQKTIADRLSTDTEQELLSANFDVSLIEKSQSDWQKRLYTPTYVTKINGMWFIVDCGHNRVIWSNDLFAPISQWKTVDSNLAGPHTIAYGAGYYAIEDTDRNRVNFYAFDNSTQHFVKRSVINLGTRPHRIHFNEHNQSFYILSSVSQDMHRVSVINGDVALVNAQKLPFLEGQYTRSFNIVGDQMLFTSGPKSITVTSFKDDQYIVQASYIVPPNFYNMNDVFFTGKKYIVTSTLPTGFGVVDKLEDLPTMQNQATEYGFIGRPYYVSQYDNALVIPEIAEYSSVRIFKLDEDHTITPHTTVHEFGGPTSSSINRQGFLLR